MTGSLATPNLPVDLAYAAAECPLHLAKTKPSIVSKGRPNENARTAALAEERTVHAKM